MTEQEIDIVQNNREIELLGRLLCAHPQYGRRALSIAQCLKHRKIPRIVKKEYVAFMIARHPTSNFGFVIL